MRSEDAEPASPRTQTELVIRLEEVEADLTAHPGAVRLLLSTDPDERRRALADLVRWGLTVGDVPSIVDLLSDPDVTLRRQAAEALAEHADEVDQARLREALDDPADEVRAAVVALAAARNVVDLSALFALVAARRWPLTQERTLEVLPRIVHRAGLSDVELTSLLQSVARLPSPPTGFERERLSELARAVGRERVAEALTFADGRRVGAVWLLVAEGTPAALRAVAGLSSDPLAEVRLQANAAREQLDEIESPVGAGDRASRTVDLVAIERGGDAEVVGFLVGALRDPDRDVRDRAWAALTLVDWDAVLAWVRENLRAGSDEDAALAAHVAERLMLSQVALPILERGSRLPPEARGPFESALASFALDPQALAAATLEVDASRRDAAVRIAWRAGGLPVVPYLRRLLDDPSGPVRSAVLEVMDEAGDPDARRIALETLEADPSAAARTAAVRTLAAAPPDLRIAALERAVRDPEPSVRAEAVQVLPRGIGGPAVSHLLQALDDGDERVWTEAVRRLGTPSSEPSVTWQALERCREGRRDLLIATLESGGADRLEEIALLGLRSPSVDTRSLAVGLAARAASRACLHGVIDALRDPVTSVRRAAAGALAGFRDPAAVPALEASLSDPDPEVRVEAVRALAVIDDRAVLRPLVTAAADPEAGVREAAVRALGSLRIGGASVDLVIDRVLELGPGIAPRGGWLLQRIVGFEQFVERLGSLDRNERLRAVEALAAIGGPRAVDALIGALGDPDQEVRLRALRGLGELGDRRAGDAVERTIHTDPVTEVVWLAEATLRKLAEPEEPLP